MMGRLYQVILCFLLAMQPASRSLSTDLYFRLAETGQPVLVTLVDTAAAELTNSAVELLELEKTNYTEGPDHNTTPVVLQSAQPPLNSTAHLQEPQLVDESQENLKSHPAVKSGSKEKDEYKVIEKSEGATNATEDIVITPKSDNATTDLESGKKPDVAKASEVQEEIPSFAEWAQKQLEEAEKNKENGVNHSAQSSMGTISSNVNLKVRSKNYASPDCGAKIVAANPEAGSSGFILSPSRDEYMLNTCNSRIWFVAELCEAIQAKKVELANFELFSSTPKNFSVYVSDRFPTREWASVGQFIAKDERDIQTFNLHPHLFGKFIRFELHSYYGSEHYCPISLFRVYGTSEFEVFETENSPHSQANQVTDDDDDDDILEDTSNKDTELSRNLFGSARDAVMSIMKKAAQVLVKGGDSKNSSENVPIALPDTRKCKTPSHIIVCDNCSNSMFTDVYDLMSCKSDVLDNLIGAPLLHDTLCNTALCQQYGLDFKSKRTSSIKTEISNYISALLMPSYVAALCNMLAIVEKKVVLNTSYETDLNVTTNLTIDKKVQKAVDSGTFNDLLQTPFTNCAEDADNPSCKNKPEENIATIIEPSITSSVPSDLVDDSVVDIKPTKTLQKDTDPVEASVLTVDADSGKIVNTQHNDKHFSEGQIIEASIVNTSDQKDTQALTKEESEKIPLIDPVKDNSVEPAKSEDPSDFGSVEILQEVKELDTLHLEGVEEGHLKLSTQDQISLDKLLSELEQANHDPATPSPHNVAPALTHQGQKESVFLRLSNRIKALERNMSLSGQYLEELSRRYKKQMEEMQRTFEKTLSSMSEENKKAEEREHRSSEEMVILQQQMAQLSVSVGTLLSDRDSFLGSSSLLKIMLFQIFLTIFVVYIFRKFNLKKPDTEKKPIGMKVDVERNKSVARRRSTEEIATNLLGEPKKPRRRRPSEEVLSITRINEFHDNPGVIKNEKKKRKRKSPVFQRSYSIATSMQSELVHKQTESSDSLKEVWVRPDINGGNIETPIALEEAEFIAPELDPVDFNRMGEIKIPNFNGITPKKEFPKTNGSIFGKKTPESEKSDKIRRLSSPAFFRAAVNRHSSRSAASDMSFKSSPIMEALKKGQAADREVRSEERQVRAEATERQVRAGTESPQLSTWSSIGDVSQTSSIAQGDSQIIKKKKSKRSLKNIFKKVF